LSLPPDDVTRLIIEAAERDSPPPGSDQSNSQPNLEIDLEEHKIEFQLQCLWQELAELKDTHALRLAYTGRIFWLVVAWLACVVICIVFSGFRYHEFRLSDAVLIAFISSTTVNVVGLFVLVAKWMYPAGGTVAVSRSELHTKAAALNASKKKTK
jgi:hypothetical protein